MSLPKVNIYSYTAAANPYFVKSLAHKYGYEFDKTQSLSSVLQQLVTFEGEPALFDIIEANPDKELFMEYFQKKYGKKDEQTTDTKPFDAYLNFSGQLASIQQTAENKRITTETSLMVLAGAVLIAFAIISKN
jgi:hypothetical protein